MTAAIRKKTFDLLESAGTDAPAAVFFDRFMIILIVTNVFAVTIESVRETKVAHRNAFRVFEWFSVFVFTIEYLLRVWTAPENPVAKFRSPVGGRLRYMMTPLALVDLIAILPFYLAFFVSIDLRFMRVFRLLRLFKLTRYAGRPCGHRLRAHGAAPAASPKDSRRGTANAS